MTDDERAEERHQASVQARAERLLSEIKRQGIVEVCHSRSLSREDLALLGLIAAFDRQFDEAETARQLLEARRETGTFGAAKTYKVAASAARHAPLRPRDEPGTERP